jgi:hypothetical protein
MGTIVAITSQPMRTLRVLLRRNGPGPIFDVEAARNALSDAWDECAGGDRTKLGAYSVASAQKLEWNPPLLTFLVDRHGGAAFGPSGAERQSWTIDLDAQTAEVVTTVYWQLRPGTPAFGVGAAARGIAVAVAAGAARPGLVWSSPESVRVILSAFMPPGPMRTTDVWRKRLRIALDAEMDGLGWTRTGSVYTRPPRP